MEVAEAETVRETKEKIEGEYADGDFDLRLHRVLNQGGGTKMCYGLRSAHLINVFASSCE